jgi:alanine racemase
MPVTEPHPDPGNGYTPREIAEWTGGVILDTYPADLQADHILVDSRKLVFPASTVFFALVTPRRNGHLFIPELYQRGVRIFVTSEGTDAEILTDACIIRVSDTLVALQQVAAAHRARFHFPVIGITGSNGKTIVKEWLNHLLSPDHRIVRSPRSYNSQIGVPLSVWQIKPGDTLGIFEAGISVNGEMSALETMIRPDIGIFTNIGDAHDEGFSGKAEKAAEKCKLFDHVRWLIYCKDHLFVDEAVLSRSRMRGEEIALRCFTWGRHAEAGLRITESLVSEHHTQVFAICDHHPFTVTIPFTDKASVENAMHCWAVMIHLGYAADIIRERMLQLPSLSMRLELKDGLNRCALINDSYNADWSALQLALDFMSNQRRHQRRTVILSDILQSGRSGQALYRDIAQTLQRHGVDRLIGIGPEITAHARSFEGMLPEVEFHPATDLFLEYFHPSHFRDETILIKGARAFGFERITQLLELKTHQTVLEINLTAIAQNLACYRRMLGKDTRLMVMVKAFSYGAGAYEIANLLQFHRADWLAVAYADEGVELRKAGIRLPIMVMNPEPATFPLLADHDLQPELYSFGIASAFEDYLKSQGIQEFPVHIKLDTGMHRLGFLPGEVDALGSYLSSTRSFRVQTVFSHLVASEDITEDAFTMEQAGNFEQACIQLQAALGHGFIRHLANTAAIGRHPALRFDMVRLGIGLYGVDPAADPLLVLQEASTLRTTVAQVKVVPAGQTVGYGRKGKLYRDSLIATIRIGYADGYPRSLGNGVGKVWIKEGLFPIVGHVCMDMTMVDITGRDDIREGDIAVVFGKEISVSVLARWAGTIPYEIMTGISQRVQRVYIEE